MPPDPFEILGLPNTAKAEEVRARWIELAAKHHPDKGGQAADFDRFQKAYNEAFNEARNRPCAACQGTGITQKQTGFFVVSVSCIICGGTGKGQVS